MQQRRQRKIHCGVSNQDFRAEEYTRPDDQSRLDFLSTHKSQKFAQLQKARMSKTQKDPLKETKNLYKSLNKLGKNRTALFPHEDDQELQEAAKFDIFSKKTLPGHSYNIFERRPEKEEVKGVFRSINKQIEEEKMKRQYQEWLESQKNQSKEVKKQLIKEKHDQHASAIQETQLVGIQNNQETLEGKVDLDKVREIRKAIRRRYANRKNFQKIFNAWDEDSTGQISTKNAYNMINKLGINCNVDEARVLVASADANTDGIMDMEEFLEMIFNDNEGLNVNLSNIPVLSKEAMDNLMNESNNIFQGDKNIKKTRHFNQLSMILKNKLSNLTSHLNAEDAEKHGFVNIERLEKVLKKLSIPDNILTEDDVKVLFEKYKEDEYKFDYNKFLKDIQDFEFNPEGIYKNKIEQEKKEKSELSYIQKMIQKYKKFEQQDPEIHVFDAYQVDSSALERYELKKFKITTMLKRYFPKRSDFDQFLMQQMGIKDQKQYENSQVSSKKLTNVLQDIILNFDEKIPNLDLEGFLSSFVYNKYKQTPCKELTRCIYEEDARDWEKKLQQQLKKPPPPSEELYHPDFPLEEQLEAQQQQKFRNTDYYYQNTENQSESNNQQNNESEKQISSSQNQNNNENTQNNEDKNSLNKSNQNNQNNENNEINNQSDNNNSKQNKNDNISKSSQHQNNTLLQSTYYRTSAFNTNINPEIQRILAKLENKVFCGTKKAYDVYKTFDYDKDGYVSQRDFVTEIQKLDALTIQETKQLIGHLYPDPKKGYLDFKEFSSQLRVGVVDNDTHGNQIVHPYVTPQHEHHEDIKNTLPQLLKKKETITEKYKPDWEGNTKMRNTRFGYTPEFKNTFHNFQSDRKSGMFQDDKKRFDRSHNHRTQFQVEEKQRKQQQDQARLQKRQFYNNQISERYQSMQDNQDKRQEINRMTKGMSQWTYEHRCHLQNNWQ